MFNSITKAISAVKDGAVEAGAKAYINQKIDGFGSVTNFQLDSKKRAMQIEVELKGETTPIRVRVGSYEVLQKEGAVYLKLDDVTASREWIGLAVKQYVAGREFRIPDSLRKWL